MLAVVRESCRLKILEMSPPWRPRSENRYPDQPSRLQDHDGGAIAVTVWIMIGASIVQVAHTRNAVHFKCHRGRIALDVGLEYVAQAARIGGARADAGGTCGYAR